MKNLNLMLISNSKNHGDTEWLGWVKKDIQEFLTSNDVKKESRILFVDFAGKNVSGLGQTPKKAYTKYVNMADETFPDYEFVSAGLTLLGMENLSYLEKSHQWRTLLSTVDAIFVAGGNTWTLAHNMHETTLAISLYSSILEGTPYVGWSAGANFVCPTICTTNDMSPHPMPERSQTGLGLILFQINPHYVDGNPDKVGGETREDRLNEYKRANPKIGIIALREGVYLKLQNGKYEVGGINENPVRIWTPKSFKGKDFGKTQAQDVIKHYSK